MTQPDSPNPGLLSADQMRERAISMYFKTDQARHIEADSAGKKSGKARRPLMWIAVIYTLAAIPMSSLTQSLLADKHPQVWLFVAAAWALALAFWGLWVWAWVSPLPAAIVGLMLNTSLAFLFMTQMAAVENQNGDTANDNSTVALGFLSYLFTTALLIKSILNGAQQRQLLQPLPDPAAEKKPRSIASALFLYVVLADLLTSMMYAVQTHALPFPEFLAFMHAEAVIVITWAICSWRDVLPAISRLGGAGNNAAALVTGCITFLFATVYTGTLDVGFHVPPGRLGSDFMSHGLSWLNVWVIIALFPALMEELAFRGVIVPCLRRALTDRETIFVSGSMFMMLHFSVISFPHLLLVGVAAGYLRLRSKSVWPCVLLHLTHNTLCLALEKWLI